MKIIKRVNNIIPGGVAYRIFNGGPHIRILITRINIPQTKQVVLIGMIQPRAFSPIDAAVCITVVYFHFQ